MKIDSTIFGAITIDGKIYQHDVVVRLSGEVVKRKKEAIKEAVWYLARAFTRQSYTAKTQGRLSAAAPSRILQNGLYAPQRSLAVDIPRMAPCRVRHPHLQAVS
jgi:hypothetical protein